MGEKINTVLVFLIFNKKINRDIRVLKKIRKTCKSLIVGLAPDEFIRSKSLTSKIKENERLILLKKKNIADEVFLFNKDEGSWKDDYKRYNGSKVIVDFSLVNNLVNLKKEFPVVDILTYRNIFHSKYSTGIILTYGTFDLLHYGHSIFLERIRKYGDTIIVGVSTDEFNKKKDKVSYESQEKRLSRILEIPFVSHAFLEKNWEQKKDDIEKYNISLVVLGKDWEEKYKGTKNFIFLKRTRGISSTQLREKKFQEEKILNISNEN